MPYQVEINPDKNRCYVTLSDLMEDDETRAAAEACIAAFHKLQPGFTVVTDISQFRPMSQAGVGEVKRVGVEGLKLGMLATCRVLGISAVTKMQFQKANREAGYVSFTATSREEAEELLDEAVRGQAGTGS